MATTQNTSVYCHPCDRYFKNYKGYLRHVTGTPHRLKSSMSTDTTKQQKNEKDTMNQSPKTPVDGVSVHPTKNIEVIKPKSIHASCLSPYAYSATQQHVNFMPCTPYSTIPFFNSWNEQTWQQAAVSPSVPTTLSSHAMQPCLDTKQQQQQQQQQYTPSIAEPSCQDFTQLPTMPNDNNPPPVMTSNNNDGSNKNRNNTATSDATSVTTNSRCLTTIPLASQQTSEFTLNVSKVQNVVFTGIQCQVVENEVPHLGLMNRRVQVCRVYQVSSSCFVHATAWWYLPLIPSMQQRKNEDSYIMVKEWKQKHPQHTLDEYDWTRAHVKIQLRTCSEPNIHCICQNKCHVLLEKTLNEYVYSRDQEPPATQLLLDIIRNQLKSYFERVY